MGHHVLGKDVHRRLHHLWLWTAEVHQTGHVSNPHLRILMDQFDARCRLANHEVLPARLLVAPRRVAELLNIIVPPTVVQVQKVFGKKRLGPVFRRPVFRHVHDAVDPTTFEDSDHRVKLLK